MECSLYHIVTSIFSMVISCTVRGGLGIDSMISFIDPPSGSVIANFEGVENITTISCNVTAVFAQSVIQATTQWNIENFRGVSGLQQIYDGFDRELFLISGDQPDPNDTHTFENRLSVLRLTSELEDITLYCGTGIMPKLANFTFRIYRAPGLQDNLTIRILENSLNVPVDLNRNPEAIAFPEPIFSWTRNGIPLSDPFLLTYSQITFASVSRNNAGQYEVSATNFILNSTEQLGSDTGSFNLDVIYGPTFAFPALLIHYALLNDSVSLICGTGLDSNPPPNISWTAPDGTTIVNSSRYNLENGPDIVRLDIQRISLTDAGMWTCDVSIVSELYVVNNGQLVLNGSTIIGTPIVNHIHLTVIAPPGQPCPPSVDNIKATSIQVLWDPPSMADSPITYYLINACNLNSTNEASKVVANSSANVTSFVVSNLLPGTTYELTVVAVSQGGAISALSQPSDPVINKTEVTVPALGCNATVSEDNIITVTWTYIHTGGLPLTNVTVYYTYDDGSIISSPNPVPVSMVTSTSVNVANLQAGFRYTFNITAVNSNGSSSILCGPTLHLNKGNILDAVVGGVVGGLFVVGMAVIIGILFTIIVLRRRAGNADISTKVGAVYDNPEQFKSKKELIYEDPDKVQQYKSKHIRGRDLDMQECPAYREPRKETLADIKLEDCPAYMEQKKDLSIRLEECPAYEESRRGQEVELEECPAYGMRT